MPKIIFAILILSIIFLTTPVNAGGLYLEPDVFHGVVTDPISLINAVNALRAGKGLPPYSINPILMAVVQQHAQYMSVAGVTHYGADGSSPWQRGLAAGYPLAGDLSLGGFYSENIIAGSNMSVQDAVKGWQADAPHILTMLSPSLTEIGAGVVLVGDYVYYVIDCARPTTSRQPQAYTPAPGGLAAAGATAATAPLVFNTIIPATPLENGKIFHVVKPGETLWLIAVSYGVKVLELRRWNNLTDTQDIYPGNKLFIKQIDTPTPIPARATPSASLAPSLLPLFTSTALPPPTITITPIHAASIPSNSSTMVLVIIVVTALFLAGVIVRAGRRV